MLPLTTLSAACIGQCRVAVAFSGVGLPDRREDAKGEVAIRIIFHEPRQLILDASYSSYHIQNDSGPGEAQDRLRASSYGSMKLSLMADSSPSPRRRTASGTSIITSSPTTRRKTPGGGGSASSGTSDDALIAKLTAELRHAKHKLKEKDAQLREDQVALAQLGEKVVALEDEERTIQDSANQQLAHIDEASHEVAMEVERLLGEVEAYQTEVAGLKQQNRQLRGALQAISSQTPPNSPRSSAILLPPVIPEDQTVKAQKKTPPNVAPRSRLQVSLTPPGREPQDVLSPSGSNKPAKVPPSVSPRRPKARSTEAEAGALAADDTSPVKNPEIKNQPKLPELPDLPFDVEPTPTKKKKKKKKTKS